MRLSLLSRSLRNWAGPATADAEVFLGMIQGKLHEKILLSVEIDNLNEQLQQQVRHALLMLTPYLASTRT